MDFLKSNIELNGFISNEIILYKITTELIENSIDALHEINQPIIKICIEKANNNLYKLIVSDNGNGMNTNNAVELCTTLYKSTKSLSDGYFGKYGIGLKASQLFLFIYYIVHLVVYYM